MKRRARLALIASALLAAAGVAAAGETERAVSPELTPAVESGSRIAQALCSGCHAVALERASPIRDAPQFRVLSRLYSATDLRRKLEDISENGHFEMPPIAIRDDQIDDVASYIASLDAGARPMPKHKTSS